MPPEEKEAIAATKPMAAPETYPCNPLGNDPYPMQFKAGRLPAAVVGTGGIRSLILACSLQKDSKQRTRIMIVDHNKSIILFWQSIKTLFADATKAIAEYERKGITDPERAASTAINRYPYIINDFDQDQQLKLRLLGLCKLFGFTLVKELVQDAVLINADWRDTDRFHRLKKLCLLFGLSQIYAYPSNIVACSEPEDREKVLDSIDKLHPADTIHTDLKHIRRLCTGRHTGKPESIYHFDAATHHDHDTVKRTLGLS